MSHILQERFTSGRSFILQMGFGDSEPGLHSNSADRGCVYVLPVWNKRLMSGRELYSCCYVAQSLSPQIAED